MGLTSTQLDTLIELARAALQAALTSPKPNYKLGERTVNYGDYLKMLRENLNGLSAMQSDIPAESINSFDSDISDTGTDNTEYEGESAL